MSALSYRTETVIHRPPEDVFDYCSDLRSELGWNPKVKYVQKLTDGPIGVGTRYRARWSNSGPTTVEVMQFDRPRRWETKAKARGMSIRFQGTVTDAASGARYAAYLELQPGRLAWLMAPIALLAMRRQDQKNMYRIREALESSTVGSEQSGHPVLSVIATHRNELAYPGAVGSRHAGSADHATQFVASRLTPPWSRRRRATSRGPRGP